MTRSAFLPDKSVHFRAFKLSFSTATVCANQTLSVKPAEVQRRPSGDKATVTHQLFERGSCRHRLRGGGGGGSGGCASCQTCASTRAERHGAAAAGAAPPPALRPRAFRLRLGLCRLAGRCGRFLVRSLVRLLVGGLRLLRVAVRLEPVQLARPLLGLLLHLLLVSAPRRDGQRAHELRSGEVCQGKTLKKLRLCTPRLLPSSPSSAKRKNETESADVTPSTKACLCRVVLASSRVETQRDKPVPHTKEHMALHFTQRHVQCIGACKCQCAEEGLSLLAHEESPQGKRHAGLKLHLSMCHSCSASSMLSGRSARQSLKEKQNNCRVGHLQTTTPAEEPPE